MSIKIKFLVIGFILGIFSCLSYQSAILHLGDKKIDMDYYGLKALGDRLTLYKKYCGKYPSPDVGLRSLTKKSLEECFPTSEKIDDVPQGENGHEILYFTKGDDFYLVNPKMGHKSVVSSRL